MESKRISRDARQDRLLTLEGFGHLENNDLCNHGWQNGWFAL